MTDTVAPCANDDSVVTATLAIPRRVARRHQPERKQPFGRASGRSLSALVAGKQVRVEYDKRDRYGRIVGIVWVRSRRGTGGGVSGSYVPAPADNQECGSAQAP